MNHYKFQAFLKELARWLSHIAAILLIVASLCYAGAADLEAEKESRRIYCDRVEAGLWPDYQGNAKEVCHDEGQ